jgi:hypothetical protein
MIALSKCRQWKRHKSDLIKRAAAMNATEADPQTGRTQLSEKITSADGKTCQA